MTNAESSPAGVLVAGTGWRAEFFARLAHVLPGPLHLSGVVGRSQSNADGLATRWGTRGFVSLPGAVRHTRPAFPVSPVPWEANPRWSAPGSSRWPSSTRACRGMRRGDR